MCMCGCVYIVCVCMCGCVYVCVCMCMCVFHYMVTSVHIPTVQSGSVSSLDFSKTSTSMNI